MYTLILALSGITGIGYCLTPFRQRKGVYFYFFLLLGIGELISLTNIFVFKIHSNIPYIIVGCLLIPALRPAYLKKRSFLLLLILFIIINTVTNMIVKNHYAELAQLLSLHIIVTMLLFIDVIKIMTVDNILPGFIVAMIFMELLDVLKLFNVLLGTPLGLYYFYSNHFISMMLAFFFCVFTERSTLLIRKFKKPVFKIDE